MECKKIAILGVFAECHGQGTRQRFFKKKFLCQVPKQGHSAKKLFKKNKKKTLLSAWAGALGKVIF